MFVSLDKQQSRKASSKKGPLASIKTAEPKTPVPRPMRSFFTLSGEEAQDRDTRQPLQKPGLFPPVYGSPGFSRGQVIQRLSIALGDLDELAHSGKSPAVGSDEYESAKVISDAQQNFTATTKEKIVKPWDTFSIFPLRLGGLRNIGNENIRIFGHGERVKGEEHASCIGGYTPDMLAQKLIALKLKKTYSGEIYLSGCNSARGKNWGFLGAFYNKIRMHCPGVRVRGNLNVAVTTPDGKQGVWTDAFATKGDFQAQRLLLTSKMNHYLHECCSKRDLAVSQQALRDQTNTYCKQLSAEMQALRTQEQKISKTHLPAAQTELANRQQGLARLQEMADKLTAPDPALQKQLSDAGTELARAKANVDNLTNQQNTLANEIALKTAEMNKAQEQLKACISDLKRLVGEAYYYMNLSDLLTSAVTELDSIGYDFENQLTVVLPADMGRDPVAIRNSVQATKQAQEALRQAKLSKAATQ